MESGQKAQLAAQLGGKLVEYDSAMRLERRELHIEFYEVPQSERPILFRMLSRLDRLEEQGTGAGMGAFRSPPKDSRPRIDGRPGILLRRRTEEDRKRSRLDRDVRTGDPEFDELVYVESNAPDEHIQTVLLSKETRRIVKTLIEQHCEVGINTQDGAGNLNELVVNYRTPDPNAESLPLLVEQLERVIEQIRSLRASLPLFVGDKKVVRRFPRVTWAYRFTLLLLLSSIGSCSATAIFSGMPVDDPPIFIVIGCGLGAAVLFVPLAWLLAYGHARGASHFRWLVVLGFVAFPPGFFGLGFATNCFLDTSRPQAHRVVAVRDPKYCSKGSYSVAVQDWRDRNGTFYLRLGSRVCGVTKRGDVFVILVKKGLWNWPWIKDFQRQR